MSVFMIALSCAAAPTGVGIAHNDTHVFPISSCHYAALVEDERSRLFRCKLCKNPVGGAVEWDTWLLEVDLVAAADAYLRAPSGFKEWVCGWTGLRVDAFELDIKMVGS